MSLAATLDADFPIPKYRRGQKVWYGWVDRRNVILPCPDCLGTRKWKAITPAGTELEADCQRCGGYTIPRGVPSLNTFEHVAAVRELTIGSVQINTAPSTHRKESPVKYMCEETGIGSGSVYDEDKLAETEEAARLIAQVKVNKSNTALEAKPERIEKHRFQYLQIKEAALEMARTAIWDAWYKHNTLCEEIDDALSDDALSTSEKCERISDHLAWSRDHRPDRNLFEALVTAARAAAERGDADLAKALTALPSYTNAVTQDKRG